VVVNVGDVIVTLALEVVDDRERAVVAFVREMTTQAKHIVRTERNAIMKHLSDSFDKKKNLTRFDERKQRVKVFIVALGFVVVATQNSPTRRNRNRNRNVR
jgi:hypothetical protein